MAYCSVREENSTMYGGWVPPGVIDLDLARWERSPDLTPQEREALAAWASKGRLMRDIMEDRQGVAGPLIAMWDRFPRNFQPTDEAWKRILVRMHERGRTVWGLNEHDYRTMLFRSDRRSNHGRVYVFAAGYVFSELEFGPELNQRISVQIAAKMIFGHAAFTQLNTTFEEALVGLGYSREWQIKVMPQVLATIALLARSTDPASITTDLLWSLQGGSYGKMVALGCGKVSRALAILGHIPEPLRMRNYKGYRERDTTGIAPEWVAVAKRWRETSTLTARTRDSCYATLLKFGLWLADKHPHVRTPDDWNAEIAADAVAMICNLKVGDYTLPDAPPVPKHRVGKPLMVNSQSGFLMNLRRFFIDVELWEWTKLRFNPRHHLTTPRKILKHKGPNPRVIDERVWLKLVWASVNLQPGDLAFSPHYPFQLVRAAAIVWTHAGLRKDEIRRLRLGCTTMQSEDIVDAEGTTPAGTVCYLTVPPGKTAKEFTKPVAPIVHEAIEDWAAVRMEQPNQLDAKTGERVPFLFLHKGRLLGHTFIDETVISNLCAKAGVPREDSRGRITSHRARASSMTALASSKNGLSLPELMKWAGHATTQSTMHYVAVRPTRLAATFAKADRMAHMIDVLIDHDAIVNGGAANGDPYKFYDLGDSYCTNPFWSTCPHRMACARCDFNLPKASAIGHALEAKASVQRFLEEVPLTDDERAAAEGDSEAIEHLVDKLARAPTLDGRTRREIDRADATPKSMT